MSRNLIEIEKDILERLEAQDKRWPISICLTNDEIGFRQSKNWIDELHRNWCSIGDHPRKLCELPAYPMCRLEFREKISKQMPELLSINDRILFLQPYSYGEEDLEILDEFCGKNSLKHVEGDVSPYYCGAKLIIVYERDSSVEEKVKELLSDIDDI